MRLIGAVAVLSFLVVIGGRAAEPPVAAASAPAAAQADSDGDGLADVTDPLPGLAESPLVWRIESLTWRWQEEAVSNRVAVDSPAWREAASLTLYARDERGLYAGSRAGACRTASPLDALVPAAVSRDVGGPFATFGVGEPEWLGVQRMRVRQLAASPRLAAGGGAQLELGVIFHNRLASDCRFDALEVPVAVGGRTLARALPAAGPMRANGFIIRGGKDAPDYRVTFVVELAPGEVAPLLAQLQQAPPQLLLEQAAGRIVAGRDDGAVDVAARLRQIVENTVAVSVRGGDGETLVWRAARRVAGRQQRVGDWGEALNGLCRQRLGRDWISHQGGLLLSLNGWDSGAWDRWWWLVHGDRVPSAVDWRQPSLDRDVRFELRGEMPSAAATAQLGRGTTDPLLLALLGRGAWQRGESAVAAGYYRQAAEMGYAPGQTWSGYFLQSGEGGETNVDAAARWFLKAAEQGYASGATWYGRCLWGGLGVSRDTAGAVRWFQRAASQGHPEGAKLLGCSLAQGSGVAADDALALRWLRRSAAQDSSAGQLALGQLALERKLGEGVDWLRCAAAQGDAKAQMRLAASLQEGSGVARDPVEASDWLRRAAEQGVAEAQRNLARCYRSGSGVARDPAAAAAWFRKAADGGDGEAQVWLAMTLIKGKSGRRQEQEAYALARRAAEQGHPLGQYLAGLFLYAGRGVEADAAAAVGWFEKAAGQQVALAQVFMGFACWQGKGVPQDFAAAVDWFRRSAEQGSPVGQIWMAHCLNEGKGVDRDLKAAREWAQKAAAQGHPGGRVMLARIPENGDARIP